MRKEAEPLKYVLSKTDAEKQVGTGEVIHIGLRFSLKGLARYVLSEFNPKGHPHNYRNNGYPLTDMLRDLSYVVEYYLIGHRGYEHFFITVKCDESLTKLPKMRKEIRKHLIQHLTQDNRFYKYKREQEERFAEQDRMREEAKESRRKEAARIKQIEEDSILSVYNNRS